MTNNYRANSYSLVSIIVFIVSTFLMSALQAQTKPIQSDAVVTFNLLENSSDNHFMAELVIENLPAKSKNSTWEIAFNSMRHITKILSNNGRLMSERTAGDFYIIRFKLRANQSTIKLQLRGRGKIINYKDAPTGYFLIEHTGIFFSKKQRIYAIKNSHVTFPKSFSIEQSTLDPFQTSIEGNPIETNLNTEETRIVPLPVEIKRNRAENDFIINANTRIVFVADKTDIAKNSARVIQKILSSATNYKLPIENANQEDCSNCLLVTTEKISDYLNAERSIEGYFLSTDSKHIVLRARTSAGFFYALQSLKQLLPPSVYRLNKQRNANLSIPAVTIIDYPRFPYRGLHLDSARHFFTVETVKRLLDLMAIHKLNYFHWHLTDDEGWRIEIKKYPELTQVGAFRSYDSTRKDANYLHPAYGSGPEMYGGYYSQNDIREIVRYAADRFITIVPEIDMPGHARAMILSLTKQLAYKNNVNTRSVQGYSDSVLSPCNEQTYLVIENILQEVASLFPGRYLHIGGDEVPQNAWHHLKYCRPLNISSSDPEYKNKIQNYFLTRVEKIVRNQNKIMAGWEEVADSYSTLTPPLLVYVWNKNSIEAVYKKAIDMGYKIVLAPAEHFYFDLAYNANPREPGNQWAGFVNTFKAYSFTPITARQSAAIIRGVQGQLWSEEITSPELLDYLAFPRVAALAEVAWTPSHQRNWRSFYDRMRLFHLQRLENYGVKYNRNEFK